MSQPTQREILSALRQLTLLVRLGYPLAEGLRNLDDGTSPWLCKVADSMDRGDTLGQALSRQPRLFSPYFRTLLEAATANPNPERVLVDLSHWLEASQRVEGQANSVLAYPVTVLTLLLGFLALGLGYISPLVFPLVAGQQAPVLLAWLGIVPLLGLLALLVSLLKGRPAGLLLWLFPEIRNLQSLASQSVWARAFGTLLGAGLPVPEALKASLAIVKDRRLRAAMARAGEAARAGANLENALARCGLEPVLIWCLEGEDVAVRVLDAADALDREVQLRADLQLRLMAPRALILIGILCALAMVTFWWPFYSATADIAS
jgi:type II secretory pathway component PulF